MTLVVPRDSPSTKTSTMEPASAVPEKVGVLSLVKLSELDLPASEAATRSGFEGLIFLSFTNSVNCLLVNEEKR